MAEATGLHSEEIGYLLISDVTTAVMTDPRATHTQKKRTKRA
jgi:hypothetical protein